MGSFQELTHLCKGGCGQEGRTQEGWKGLYPRQLAKEMVEAAERPGVFQYNRRDVRHFCGHLEGICEMFKDKVESGP